jgi:hypothetical protein
MGVVDEDQQTVRLGTRGQRINDSAGQGVGGAFDIVSPCCEGGQRNWSVGNGRGCAADCPPGIGGRPHHLARQPRLAHPGLAGQCDTPPPIGHREQAAEFVDLLTSADDGPVVEHPKILASGFDPHRQTASNSDFYSAATFLNPYLRSWQTVEQGQLSSRNPHLVSSGATRMKYVVCSSSEADVRMPTALAVPSGFFTKPGLPLSPPVQCRLASTT